MATVGQVYYNVIDNNSGSPISSGVDIFSDIVKAYNAKSFTKLGVQAPSGTQMVMNNNKTIMVGRTGIYELDEDISITSMYFVRPRLYVKDEELSQTTKEEGEAGMQAAEAKRQKALDSLNKEYAGKEQDDNYWAAYNQIQSTYIEEYKIALNKYNQGSNGIYTLPDPNNPDSSANYKDLENIIVDFIYE